MPRLAKLRIKNGYWYTAAGGGRYFGCQSAVEHTQAKRSFHDFIRSLTSTWHAGSNEAAVVDLANAFLAWVQKNRSDRTFDERRRHLQLFCKFTIGDVQLGKLRATDIKASDLESFLTYLKEGDGEREAVDPFTADKYATSVKAAFNWGTKHPSPTPILPNGFRPFVTIEKYKRPIEAMMENNLLTFAEIDALFRHADADLGLVRENGKVRRRHANEYRIGDANPYKGFEDVLRSYHATGARTSELASAVVGDYSRTSRQIVLRKHKRAKTQKSGAARRITVNDQLAAILDRWCHGKKSDDPIFTDPKGRPWTRYTLDNRFQRVRELAGVRQEAIIYSFRHLWISDALMSGLDVATVSRMAGTSIAMIEKVYGHFRSDHLREAQALLDAGRERRRANDAAKTSAA